MIPLRSTSIGIEANSLLLFQLREKRHGDLHKVPIVLCRHEMNEASDLVKAALFCSNSFYNRSYKLAVLAPTHLSAEQRLPRGRLKVLPIDDPKTASCGAWLTTL